MAIEYRAFWVPKHGSSAEEYEDAYAADPAAGRFAVADGAAESVFAASWAQFLVKQFVNSADFDPRQWSDWLPAVQKDWADGFRGRELPWYAEVKLQQGAFATFLGVVLTRSNKKPYDWHGFAVGDSCLFHTRNEGLLEGFPMTKSQDFGTTPWLLGSRTPVKEISKNRAVEARGIGYPSDRLWMMTDALSQWFWREHEEGKKPLKEMDWIFSECATNKHFEYWIKDLREAKRLRNDDVTLLTVTL